MHLWQVRDSCLIPYGDGGSVELKELACSLSLILPRTACLFEMAVSSTTGKVKGEDGGRGGFVL